MIEEKLPPLTETRPGIYRHYKNLMYEVLGTARHSETLEPMTLYKKWGQTPISNAAQQRDPSPKGLSNLDSDPNFCLWVRPAAMFAEDVVIDGVRQPRFAWVGESARRFE
jgi:hypothetical protein